VQYNENPAGKKNDFTMQAMPEGESADEAQQQSPLTSQAA
jgi:hypothetical protein